MPLNKLVMYIINPESKITQNFPATTIILSLFLALGSNYYNCYKNYFTGSMEVQQTTAPLHTVGEKTK